MSSFTHQFTITLALFAALFFPCQVHAGGGYFSLGYGHVGKQMAGAVTAVAEDAFAGSSNPGKLTAVGNQLEFGIELLNPNREVKRQGATDSATIYNFSSTSRNSVFVIPDFAYSRQVNEKLAIGITIYANGGLNNEYATTTEIPGTSANPEACDNKPGNFFVGCGHAGFDLSQLIIAPTIAWKFLPGHSIGFTPLIAAQRFEAFGLQAFAPVSSDPDNLTNNGHEVVFGAGARIGWYGELKPWLSMGAAYSSKVYMQQFKRYKGLFAEGEFDVPANYSIGIAIKPVNNWTIAVDIQRIEYSKIKALSNGVLNSLVPGGPLMGTSSGSGFSWQRDQINYKLGLSYNVSNHLTLRTGYEFGHRTNEDNLNAVSIGVLTPNSEHRASVGFSWESQGGNEFHMALAHFFKDPYSGPSAIIPGSKESLEAHANTLHISWNKSF